MALTATDTYGFERKYSKTGFPTNPVSYAGSTGTTYTMGRLATIPAPSGSGMLVTLTSTGSVTNTNPIIGVIAETKTCTPTDYMVKVYDNPFDVYKVSFDGHTDLACGGSTASNQFKMAISTTASTAANLMKGSLIHIYEGPGKGDTRTVTANTAASPGVITVAPAFSATPTTASKAVVLCGMTTAGKTDTKGVNVGTPMLKVSSNSDGKVRIDPSNTNNYLNVVDIDPANLTMDVMIAFTKHAFGMGQSTT